MRRRRTAAPSSAETENTEPTSSSSSSEASTGATDTEVTSAASSSPLPPAGEQGEHYAAPAPDSPAETEKPRRPRRTSARRKAAAEEAPAEDAPAEDASAAPSVVEVVAEASAAPAEPTPAEPTPAEPTPAEPTPAEPAPAEPEKPKRSRRRTSAKAAAAAAEEAAGAPAPEPETAPEVVVAPEAEAPVAPVAAAEEAVVAEASEPAAEPVAPADPEKPKRSRRRSSRKSAGEADTAEAPPADATSPVPDAVEATPPAEATPEAAEAPVVTPPKRTRGPRRIAVTPPATAAEAALATTSTADTTTAAAPDTAATPAAAEETAAGEGRPRRTRGQRRKAVTRVVTAEGVVEDPAAAAALLGGGAAAVVAAPSVEVPTPSVYQPLPDEVLARLVEAKIAVRKGVAELIIGGEPHLPLWFFVNTEMAEDLEAGREVARRQIRYAYEAGVRIFTVLAHLPWKTRSGERRYEPLEESLRFIAECAGPEALILPRLIFSPPLSWERAHPDQMIHYADGSTGDVSLASRAFWEEEAVQALHAAVERVAEGPYANRVFGFYLEHGEWFHEKGRGYDRSEANVAGFRAWLRQHYKNSQIALRAAWHDGSVTFDNADIPPAPPTPSGSVFFGEREGRWVDFHAYSSDLVAQVILRLGQAVKEASGNRSVVAVSYGYTLELPRASSGHLALGQILESPVIDILTGPLSYGGRMPGGSAPLPAPVDSVTLAGKLWVSEDDTKTFLAGAETPDTYNPKVATSEGTRAVHARNFGAALARGTGVSWMDLWGEGWLDDRDIWQNLGRLVQIADRLATRRRNPRTRSLREPDVAVIVDEKSFFDVHADEDLLGHLVAYQRDVLVRSGARIGFYLLSDLAKKNFPEQPKLLLFLNAFRIPQDVRAAITRRFQNDGRTLAWLFGPGCREANPAELTDVIGMQLRLQPWGSKAGTQVTDGRSPLTDGLRGQRLGEEKRVNPTYYVSDPRAQVLGEYVYTGNPSIAVRKHPRWQSVFIGETTLTVPLLRGLYRLAGVPVATVDDDVAWVADNLICLHSAPGGGTTVYLPEEGVLYDLWGQETLATGGLGARLSMPPRGTRLLFYGSEAEVTRFGGDPTAGMPGLTEEELPPSVAPFVFEEEEHAAGDEISAEDAALMEAALAGALPELKEGDTDLEDEDDEAASMAMAAPVSGGEAIEAEVDASENGTGKRKRRRRRRGRGRGASEEAGEELGGDALTEEGSEAVGEGEDAAVGAPASAPETGEGEIPPVVRRPSLEELLPLSELTDESELPPIPEEFLPLDTDALLPAITEGDAAESGAEAGEGAPVARRPRRSRVRRGRRGSDSGTGEAEEGGGSAAATNAPGDSDPPGGAPDSETP